MKERIASLIVSFFVLAGGFCTIFSVLPENARAVTLFVGGGGPGNYTTIQGAVDDANPGDTVFVYSGTYIEFVRIRTPINLVGENKDTTIIGGNYEWSGIMIRTNWVNVTGFTVTKQSFVSAISLMNVENCTVSNNTVSYFEVGISLSESHNNTIINNSVILNNQSGITIGESNNNLIAGNTISWNIYGGIALFRSFNNTLDDNVMIGNGLYMYGQDVEHWNSHTIDASNTVSGKPVRYLKNAVGGAVPADAGQVILANCTSVVVENQNIDNSTMGMVIAFSSKNYVANSTVASNVLWGIWFVQSHENYVFSNTVLLNGDGFELEDSNNNTFVDNNVTYNNWDGFYLEIANNNTMTDNEVSFNGYTGIVSERSVRNKLTGNQMVDNGVTLSGDSVEYWNTHIIDASNTVNGKPLHYWKNATGGTVPSGAGQVILANCSGSVVENQNVSDGNNGITAGFSTDILAISNIANSSKGSGIYLYRSNRNNVYSNIAHSNSGSGVYLYFSEDNTVVDNTVSNNSYGVRLFASDGNSILSNTIEKNKHDGIRFGTSNQNNTITGNFLWANDENGIHFTSSGNFDNLIANNTVRSNKLNGILLNYSKRNVVSNNTVIWNHEYGAYLWDCDENVVVNNTFDNNEFSISLSHSALNTIYHNIFGDSTSHAFDDGVNFWNTSYPWGGNFWSYYDVADVYSGPDQDLAGSDGIGDVPYNIPGGTNKDWYPLMVPDFPSSPSEPRNLQATAGNGEVTLAWEQPTKDGGRSITNYTIYRGDESGQEAFLVEIDNVLTYVDTGLTNGQTYYYEVSATNILGEGPRSNEANATPMNILPICNITDPINGATISGTIIIAGIASDTDGTVEKVEIRIDSASWIEVTGTTLWGYEWNTSTVSNGDHTVYARSYDGEDYSIEVSISITVDNPVQPPPVEPEEDLLWVAVVASVVSLVIVLSLLYFLLRRRQKPEGVESPETTEHLSD